MRQTQMDTELRVGINSPKIHPQRDPVKPRQEGSLHLFLPSQPQHSDIQQKTQNSRRRMKSRGTGVETTKGFNPRLEFVCLVQTSRFRVFN